MPLLPLDWVLLFWNILLTNQIAVYLHAKYIYSDHKSRVFALLVITFNNCWDRSWLVSTEICCVLLPVGHVINFFLMFYIVCFDFLIALSCGISNMVAPARVKIMGHSFFAHLQDLTCSSHSYNYNLNLNVCVVSYSTLQGGTISRFRTSQLQGGARNF